jgi:hypothetical protein
MEHDPDWISMSKTRRLKPVTRSMQKARKSGRSGWLKMKDGSQDRNLTYLEKVESNDKLSDQEFEDRSRNFRGTTTLAERGQSFE